MVIKHPCSHCSRWTIDRDLAALEKARAMAVDAEPLLVAPGCAAWLPVIVVDGSMANERIIATGHRPPRGAMRIVSAGGYELAVLRGERVEDIVEAAEAVLDEMLKKPGLGEPDEWRGDA